MSEKNLIISADDFGKSELANKNILRLAEAGKLDRVSVMADGNFKKEEIEKLAAAGAKIDVHLHIQNWLEDREKTKESFAKRGLIFLGNYFFGVFSRRKVEKEWERQISELIKIAGKAPDGLNAHRYDHFFPVYFPLAVKLAKKFGINQIRFGKILPAEKNIIAAGILRFFWKKNKKNFSKSGLRSYAHCINLDWISKRKRFFDNFRDGEVELVVHPERREEYDFILDNF